MSLIDIPLAADDLDWDSWGLPLTNAVNDHDTRLGVVESTVLGLVAVLPLDATPIASNTTPAPITGLSVTVAANKVYQLVSNIIYTSNGGPGNAQLQCTWYAPAGTTVRWRVRGLTVNSASAVTGPVTLDVADVGSNRSFGAAGVGSPLNLDINAIVRTGAAIGTLGFSAAQVVSQSAPNVLTIRADSYVILRELGV